jgi:hypothetical protein
MATRGKKGKKGKRVRKADDLDAWIESELGNLGDRPKRSLVKKGDKDAPDKNKSRDGPPSNQMMKIEQATEDDFMKRIEERKRAKMASKNSEILAPADVKKASVEKKKKPKSPSPEPEEVDEYMDDFEDFESDDEPPPPPKPVDKK